MAVNLLYAHCYMFASLYYCHVPSHGCESLICPLLCCLPMFSVAMTLHMALDLSYAHYYIVCFCLLLPWTLTWLWISYMHTTMRFALVYYCHDPSHGYRSLICPLLCVYLCLLFLWPPTWLWISYKPSAMLFVLFVSICYCHDSPYVFVMFTITMASLIYTCPYMRIDILTWFALDEIKCSFETFFFTEGKKQINFLHLSSKAFYFLASPLF